MELSQNHNKKYDKVKKLVSDYIPQPKTQEELDAIDSNLAKNELIQIDNESIRDIRAWILSQPSAPNGLKDKELMAVSARKRLI